MSCIYEVMWDGDNQGPILVKVHALFNMKNWDQITKSMSTLCAPEAHEYTECTSK